MRSDTDNQTVFIGIKDKNQPDDGSETLLPVSLSSTWKTYVFDLSKFRGANLAEVYLPTEFVFKELTNGLTLYFRNIQYLP
jgi:hypothetical protein